MAENSFFQKSVKLKGHLHYSTGMSTNFHDFFDVINFDRFLPFFISRTCWDTLYTSLTRWLLSSSSSWYLLRQNLHLSKDFKFFNVFGMFSPLFRISVHKLNLFSKLSLSYFRKSQLFGKGCVSWRQISRSAPKGKQRKSLAFDVLTLIFAWSIFSPIDLNIQTSSTLVSVPKS